MDVESPVSGTLVEIVVESGMVAVGEPIGWVEGEDDGGGFGDLLMAPETPEQVEAPVPEPDPVSDAGPATPGARAAAPQRHRARRPPCPRAGPRAGRRPGHGHPVRAGRPGARRGRRGVGAGHPAGTPAVRSCCSRRRPRERRGLPRSRADRRAAIRAVVARTMTPSAAIPQFTVWREVHLDAAERDPRRPVLDHGPAARVRRVAARGARAAEPLGGRPGHRGGSARDRAGRGHRPGADGADVLRARPRRRRRRSTRRSARWWPRPTTGRLDRAYLGVANGSLSNLGGLGVDRFQALLTPPQAQRAEPGVDQARPVAVPGGVGTRAHRGGRAHRRPPGGRRGPRGPAAGADGEPAGRRDHAQGSAPIDTGPKNGPATP